MGDVRGAVVREGSRLYAPRRRRTAKFRFSRITLECVLRLRNRRPPSKLV